MSFSAPEPSADLAMLQTLMADPAAFKEKLDALARAKAELDASMALQAKLAQIPVLREDAEQALLKARADQESAAKALADAQAKASSIVAEALAEAQRRLDSADSTVAVRVASVEAEIAANTEASNRDRNEASAVNADCRKREAAVAKREIVAEDRVKQAEDAIAAATAAKEKADNLIMRVRLAITEE